MALGIKEEKICQSILKNDLQILELASNVEKKAICLENALKIRKEEEEEDASNVEVKVTWQKTVQMKKQLLDQKEAASNVGRWDINLLIVLFRKRVAQNVETKDIAKIIVHQTLQRKVDASNVGKMAIEQENARILHRKDQEETKEIQTWKIE